MKKIYYILVTLIVLVTTISCEKYLDVKPDESLATPSSVEDLQALMDYYFTINQSEPTANDASADDYYFTDVDYNSLSNVDDQKLYTWEKENLYANAGNDWYGQYKVIYFSNAVIAKAAKIKPTIALNNAIGQAYYYRGKCFYNLAQLYTKAYHPNASKDLGLPLRLNENFNEVSVRANNEQTYQQIINDIAKAIQHLPNTQISKYRPSKQAAYGLMARVFLTMGNFENAYKYADSCLTLTNQLMDFNTLNASLPYPIPLLNSEILAQQTIPATPPMSEEKVKIPYKLYQLYLPNDLRKDIYFKLTNDNSYLFRGSYESDLPNFGGIAIDEVYLIKAEANVRLGRINEGLNDLNKLLIKRFKTGTYMPYQNLTNLEALNLILTERRKELLMRGLRWTDIKRLNVLGAEITLTRVVNGNIYKLLPNSLRFALPIPEAVIKLSGMPQNPY